MSNNIVKVHPLTEDPTAAWVEISKTQIFIPLELKMPKTPVEPNKVRIVCMSDTHSENGNITFKIPDGDIFVHAGDFTRCGHSVEKFNRWMKSLPHQHKIVICGNHELTFDHKYADVFHFITHDTNNIIHKRQLLPYCIYLEDSEIILYGIKFYGSPWQPSFKDGAFILPRGEQCLSKWNLIPDDTDVLITHGPPLGRQDVVQSGKRTGCVELMSTIQQRVKPKYHIFGHIHEGYGVSFDGTTVFINASTCNTHYVPRNLPIVFDIPLPEGHTKS